ncbi:MAG TPA: nuclear transport factor 2 family protein, partial [Nitrolancea sp.]|nr:nuclear transport factor 2 family protein [Nitrolancea sp.]
MDSSTIEPAEVVRNVVAALNRGAVADVLRLCADDLVLWSPSLDSAGQSIRGKEQLRQHLEFAEESWPGIWMSIDSIVAAGDLVALELTSVVSTERAQIV